MSAASSVHPHHDLAIRLSERRTFLWLNVVGGLLVLGSYVWGFVARPDAMAALWGGVPESARPLYTNNMFLAAAGFLTFTSYLYFSVWKDLDERAPGGHRLGILNMFYAMVLIPSALWLPLTTLMVDHPSPLIWLVVRLDLALVGLGTLGIAMATLVLDTRRTAWRIAAVVGLLPFGLQTVVLDALVWPAYFPSTAP